MLPQIFKISSAIYPLNLYLWIPWVITVAEPWPVVVVLAITTFYPGLTFLPLTFSVDHQVIFP